VNSSKSGAPAPWIGITGTSGKSTTLDITRLIFEEACFRVGVVSSGNSIMDAVLDPDLDFVLLEVSSFELQFAYSFSFDVSVILNIDEDHINWHGSSKEYATVKTKIFNNTVKSCIFNADDKLVDQAVQDAEVIEGARAIGFTHHSPGRSQIGQVGGILTDRAFYEDNSDPLRYLYANEIADLNKYEMLKAGVGGLAAYLLEDIAAATAIAKTYDIQASEIELALERFRLPHSSNELVYKRELRDESKYGIGAIYYVDDTNSNNPHSTEVVIKTYPPQSVVWIAGGYTKGIDYDLFTTRISPYISSAIVICEENNAIWKSLRRHALEIPAYRIDPNSENVLIQALDKANELVFENQTILLSPSAVPDYGNCDDLSKQFIDYVNNLKEEIHEKALRKGVI
jgi:UDP-N-acetylmuramoylalanine--D-glutamate ligase